jgi:hypothetical protein
VRRVLAFALLVVALSPTQARANGPGYITIQFGRTMWQQAVHCDPAVQAPTLGDVADALEARGLVATGGIVLDRTPDTGLYCWHGWALHAGYDRILALQARGWSFVSQSQTYRQMPTLTYDEQVAESCGTIPTLEAHGVVHPDAMFAYPANKSTDAIQADPVNGCFAYGRRYASNALNVRSQMSAPWFQRTQSVAGGLCNLSSLPCYTKAGTTPTQPTSRYTNPMAIVKKMAVAPDTWYAVQFYRFVSGTWQYPKNHGWDCTGSDWRTHWTSNGELYCWEDFLQIADAAQAAVANGAVDAGPYDVAVAWGRR